MRMSPDDLIHAAREQDEEELFDYLIDTFPGYTRFKDYEEFESCVEVAGRDSAIETHTVFDTHQEMRRYAEQEWAADQWYRRRMA